MKNYSKLTTSKFSESEYVMEVHELYTLADRNGSYLPAEKSSAFCEVMIFQILQGICCCPKYQHSG
jgi:hypothetical protein